MIKRKKSGARQWCCACGTELDGDVAFRVSRGERLYCCSCYLRHNNKGELNRPGQAPTNILHVMTALGSSARVHAPVLDQTPLPETAEAPQAAPDMPAISGAAQHPNIEQLFEALNLTVPVSSPPVTSNTPEASESHSSDDGVHHTMPSADSPAVSIDAVPNPQIDTASGPQIEAAIALNPPPMDAPVVASTVPQSSPSCDRLILKDPHLARLRCALACAHAARRVYEHRCRGDKRLQPILALVSEVATGGRHIPGPTTRDNLISALATLRQLSIGTDTIIASVIAAATDAVKAAIAVLDQVPWRTIDAHAYSSYQHAVEAIRQARATAGKDVHMLSEALAGLDEIAFAQATRLWSNQPGDGMPEVTTTMQQAAYSPAPARLSIESPQERVDVAPSPAPARLSLARAPYSMAV